MFSDIQFVTIYETGRDRVTEGAGADATRSAQFFSAKGMSPETDGSPAERAEGRPVVGTQQQWRLPVRACARACIVQYSNAGKLLGRRNLYNGN